ncbi:MAG: hypothetical protein HQL87_04715 [Magnetococcales bacterium]|nr:hypothetical protein [Magnetococcales bacterium]
MKTDGLGLRPVFDFKIVAIKQSDQEILSYWKGGSCLYGTVSPGIIPAIHVGQMDDSMDLMPVRKSGGSSVMKILIISIAFPLLLPGEFEP